MRRNSVSTDATRFLSGRSRLGEQGGAAGDDAALLRRVRRSPRRVAAGVARRQHAGRVGRAPLRPAHAHAAAGARHHQDTGLPGNVPTLRDSRMVDLHLA